MIRKEDIILAISTCLFIFLILTMASGCATKPEFEGTDQNYKLTDCILKNIQDTTIDNLHEFCRKRNGIK